ncbi:MAG: hypothetical protein NWF14_00585 [Candidatus Bathyarchaeota archaeon]|nr:hypothetical protein [Candidatus Bathyarchaeota archaeon]
MSVSEKLADYKETMELLDRLKVWELRELARQNDIPLETEDISGKVRRARNKEEIVDVLVESEFNESDLVKLLSISRLKKEELLNHMKVTQLKRLAKETGVLLEKSSLFGTKKAIKKRDIVDALKVLSTSKVRDQAQKVSLITKSIKKKSGKSKYAKLAAQKIAAKRRKTRKLKKPVAKPIKKPIKKAVKRPVKKTVKAPKKRPPKKKEMKVEAVEAPRQRETRKEVGIVEEAVKERIIERQIIRRRFARASDDEMKKEVKRIKKMDPEKIKVIVKKAKKK